MVVPKPRREILKALSDLGRIDVLINNAGMGGSTIGFPSVAAVAMAQLHRFIGVNLLRREPTAGQAAATEHAPLRPPIQSRALRRDDARASP
jgi:NAD(P)-dependent dehydrogenase (short-subunit alcohol dehydrogenase family)